MARYTQSLAFNLEYERDVQRHRDHRSKKGRNCHNRADSPRFNLYKKKKWELNNQNDDESLLYLK